MQASEREHSAAPAVSFVHEWLTEWGGSEDVTRLMLRCYPDARLYATIDHLLETDRQRLGATST